MTTLNISLPNSMRSHIEEQTRSGRYSTASEYVRSLIREDQKRKAQERLEAMLLDGLASGEAKPLTREDWEDIKQQVSKRLGKRRKSAR